MMGVRRVNQEALFYAFSLERHVPAGHLVRAIDGFIDLSDLRSRLAPFYSSTGRPSIDPELVCAENLVRIDWRRESPNVGGSWSRWSASYGRS